MKKRIFAAALTAAALSWSVGSVSAQSSGTAAEARAMLDNAVVALKANEATALAAMTRAIPSSATAIFMCSATT